MYNVLRTSNPGGRQDLPGDLTFINGQPKFKQKNSSLLPSKHAWKEDKKHTKQNTHTVTPPYFTVAAPNPRAKHPRDVQRRARKAIHPSNRGKSKRKKHQKFDSTLGYPGEGPSPPKTPHKNGKKRGSNQKVRGDTKKSSTPPSKTQDRKYAASAKPHAGDSNAGNPQWVGTKGNRHRPSAINDFYVKCAVPLCSNSMFTDGAVKRRHYHVKKFSHARNRVNKRLSEKNATSSKPKQEKESNVEFVMCQDGDCSAEHYHLSINYGSIFNSSTECAETMLTAMTVAESKSKSEDKFDVSCLGTGHVKEVIKEIILNPCNISEHLGQREDQGGSNNTEVAPPKLLTLFEPSAPPEDVTSEEKSPTSPKPSAPSENKMAEEKAEPTVRADQEGETKTSEGKEELHIGEWKETPYEEDDHLPEKEKPQTSQKDIVLQRLKKWSDALNTEKEIWLNRGSEEVAKEVGVLEYTPSPAVMNILKIASKAGKSKESPGDFWELEKKAVFYIFSTDSEGGKDKEGFLSRATRTILKGLGAETRQAYKYNQAFVNHEILGLERTGSEALYAFGVKLMEGAQTIGTNVERILRTYRSVRKGEIYLDLFHILYWHPELQISPLRKDGSVNSTYDSNVLYKANQLCIGMNVDSHVFNNTVQAMINQIAFRAAANKMCVLPDWGNDGKVCNARNMVPDFRYQLPSRV